jgi:hypothetical protein
MMQEEVLKLMQQSSYQPIYVMSNIRGPSQFEFKPPSPEEIPGDEVYFAFLPKGDKWAYFQYEVNVVWKLSKRLPRQLQQHYTQPQNMLEHHSSKPAYP